MQRSSCIRVAKEDFKAWWFQQMEKTARSNWRQSQNLFSVLPYVHYSLLCYGCNDDQLMRSMAKQKPIWDRTVSILKL